MPSPAPTCPACGQPCDIEKTRTNKPYLVCYNGCGYNGFIRSARGVEKFKQRYGWDPDRAPAAAPTVAEPGAAGDAGAGAAGGGHRGRKTR